MPLEDRALPANSLFRARARNRTRNRSSEFQVGWTAAGFRCRHFFCSETAASVKAPERSLSQPILQVPLCWRTVLIGLLLVPVVLSAWSIGQFRSPVSYPLDGVPMYVAPRVWANGYPEAVYHEVLWLTPEGTHPAWHAEAAKLFVPIPDTSFGYPPILLLIMRPIVTVLTGQQYLWALAVVNAIAVLVLGYQSARRLTSLSEPGRWLVTLALCVSFPVQYGGTLGQNVIIAASLAFGGFVLLSAGGHRQWAGIGLLILACMFKQWCVLLFGVLPLLRLWRLSVGAAIGYLALLWAIPLAVLPAAIWSGYFTVMTLVSTVTQVAYNEISLRALIARLSLPDWPLSATRWGTALSVEGYQLAIELALIVPVGLAFAWLLWTRRPSLLHAGTCAMAVVLVSLSLCWTHFLVFALPMVVLAIADRSSPTWLRALGGVAALWFINLLAPFPPRAANLQPYWVWALALGAPLLLSTALPLLWLWCRPIAPDPNGIETHKTPLAAEEVLDDPSLRPASVRRDRSPTGLCGVPSPTGC
jgi:hypothetical protein